MAKEFYTERDIEDLFKRGILSLNVDEHVILTELAYEKANRLGLKLIQAQADTPPSAPIRPYISEPAPSKPPTVLVPPPLTSGDAELKERILSAVHSRLGDQIEPKLLASIIQRVLASTGVK